MPDERRRRGPGNRKDAAAEAMRAERRHLTLQLAQSGAPYRQIVEELERQGVPTSLATVKADLDYLDEEYREQTFRSREAQMLMDLRVLDDLKQSVYLQAISPNLTVRQRNEAIRVILDIVRLRGTFMGYSDLSMRERTEVTADELTPQERAVAILAIEAVREGRLPAFFEPERYQLPPSMDEIPPPPPAVEEIIEGEFRKEREERKPKRRRVRRKT